MTRSGHLDKAKFTNQHNKLSCCLLAAAILISAACAPVKGYVGPTQPSDKTALVRAKEGLLGSARVWISLRLSNPPVQVDTLDPFHFVGRSSLISFLPPEACLTVWAASRSCGWKDHSKAEIDLCFPVDAGAKYEILVLGERDDLCPCGVNIMGIRVVDNDSRKTLNEHAINDYCPPAQ